MGEVSIKTTTTEERRAPALLPEERRLHCLKLAAESAAGDKPEEIIAAARQFSAFVDGNEPAAPVVTDEMVDRFLGWHLPDNFAPDGGIKFDSTRLTTHPELGMPTGTNLFDATQARAMLEYVVAGKKSA